MQELLSQRHVKLLKAESVQSAIEQLGQLLVADQAITPGYIEEVLVREHEFPTGLDFGHIKIAIPHATSGSYVLHTAIAIGRVEKPLVFYSMEDNERALAVEIICLLAISDPLKHLEMLKKIISIFQDKAVSTAMLSAESADGLYAIFDKTLR